MVSLFFVQFFCCAFLTGLIWLVQVVHYPAFEFVKENKFASFHAFHSRSIAYIVAPVMLAELTTALILAWLMGNLFFTVNLLTVVALWLLTGLVSVPIHKKLAREFDSASVRALVSTNWPRTLLWSLRSVALLWYCLSTFQLKGGDL